MMKKALFKKIFVFICLMIIMQIAHSQTDNNIIFEYLTIEDGLSHNMVYSLLQDRQGFMWFGARYGLNKYDGAKMTVYTYDPDNPNSISNNYAWNLFEDNMGTLWICTWGGGLNKFDPVSETFTRYQHDENNPNSLSNDNVWSIYQDSTGLLWVATEGGLNQFDPVTETFIHHQHDPKKPNSLSHNTVTLISEDKTGFLWIGTYGGGLNQFDPTTQTFTAYQHDGNNPNNLSNDFIWTVYKDSAGMLWIGTEGGLNQFDPIKKTFLHYQHDKANLNSLSHNTVISIYEDNTGSLWVGTYGGGLNQFNRKTNQFIRYQNDARFPNSLSDNIVWFINGDVTNTLWIGTSNGVSKYDSGSHQFTYYQHNPKESNSLSDNLVTALYEDENNILWIGTQGGGLNQFDRLNNMWRHYRHEDNNPHSLSDNNIVAIHPDPNGTLWLGTQGGGLNQFEASKKRFIRYQHEPNNPNSLNSDVIIDSDVDSKGNVWVGMDGGGLDKFEPSSKTFTHYTHNGDNSNSLVSDWVKAVYVDSSDSVWIGADGGLSRFNPNAQQFTNYRPNPQDLNSLSNDTVNTIYEDSQGIIWIGTNDGLNKLVLLNQTFTVYRKKQGLSGNSVLGILEDNHGYLWISTNKGLSKFDPKTNLFRNYDQRDGLQGNLFVFHSTFKSKSGELFFGGLNGFNAFYPDKLNDNPYISPLFLTDFQLFNQPIIVGDDSPLKQHINFAKQILLSYKQSVFSFEFAALNYRSSDKNQYAYMMEGVDREWVTVDSSRRFATYTQLAPGDYTFKVKASNNDGLWNKKGIAINVIIWPPWWKTWYAQILYVVAILGSIIGLFIIQQRKLEQTRAINERLQETDKLKDEFLANTSHELRTPLNGIIGLAESLLDGVAGQFSEKANTNLTMIISSAKRLSSLINDILDFSKLKHKQLELQIKPVSLRETVEIILTLSRTLVGQKSIKLINAIAPNLPNAYADENRLQQILYNLVGNAIKFTEKGQIHISATVVKHNIKISVSDTGIGLPKNKLNRIFKSFEQADGSTARKYGGTGLGLTVTKQLVELQGGKIWVESTIGIGSQFHFTLPISESQWVPSSPVNSLSLSKIHQLDIEREQLETQTRSQQNQNMEQLETQTRFQQEQNEEQFKLLIVDDEPVNLQVLNNYLSLQNYYVVQANSGAEALQLIEKGFQPDAVLLDVMMPKMTGYEVTKKLRETWSEDQLPIVLLTAKNQIEDIVMGLESGANDYITKPFSKKELIARMKTHIRVSQLKAKTLQLAEEQKEKLFQVNKAYERFVPHDFLSLLNKKSILDVKLGHSVEKEMTILFSDIRDFTSVSEGMTPQENFNFINTYLSQMTPIIHQYNGFIDKYIGDAIMALFPTHADDAVCAAIAMLKKLDNYNEIRQQSGLAAIGIGIGLNTGPLMLGTVGDENRMDGTVISDAVNLASRLEGLTKTYRTPLLISEATYLKLSDASKYLIRKLAHVKVKGKSKYVNVFEVFSTDNQTMRATKLATRYHFEKAVHLYQKQYFAKAQELFQTCCSSHNALDTTAEVYIQRCQKFLNINTNENWEEIAAVVEWDSKFSIHHELIDQQHQELFKMTKSLIMSIGNEEAETEVDKIMRFLKEYVVIHFDTEENLMLQYDYPDYFIHKAQHKSLIERFAKIERDYKTRGGKLYLILEIQHELVDWLINHVANADQKLGKFLNK